MLNNPLTRRRIEIENLRKKKTRTKQQVHEYSYEMLKNMCQTKIN